MLRCAKFRCICNAAERFSDYEVMFRSICNAAVSTFQIVKQSSAALQMLRSACITNAVERFSDYEVMFRSITNAAERVLYKCCGAL